MTTDLRNAPVLVVGAGIMGAGIVQVAALAGHPVMLFDMREGAARQSRDKLEATLDALVSKGRLKPEAAQAALSRITPIASLDEAAQARLVIEAIVEQLDAKRSLFSQIEGIVDDDAILATNTSSISVTAIANGLSNPGRLVGMHFFNPVPLMKLVEVVSGLQTDAVVAESIYALSLDWGKVPVHAKSTPGFIVNRIARPYYAETLALLQEQAATPQILDACLKAAGFRMGPCELMDLIGHDTNYAVTQSVFEANFFDKRYVPSGVQREMVAGGLLGRKSGRGFYTYADGKATTTPIHAADFGAPSAPNRIAVHGNDAMAEQLAQAASAVLASRGSTVARERASDWTGLAVDGARLVLTDGRTAQQMARQFDAQEVAVFDRPIVQPGLPGTALAYAVAPGCRASWGHDAGRWLAALGWAPVEVADTPGLVVARTIAMIVNEAADAVQQGVCSTDGADAAMKLGVNYPAGPFEWLAQWSVEGVIGVLRALDDEYRGERYRVSPWLRRKA